MGNIRLILLLIFFIIISVKFFTNPHNKFFEMSGINNPVSVNETKKYEVTQNYRDNMDDVTLSLNNPPFLSGKTKNEVYQLRKQYVAHSIFNDSKYEPSEEVFGQIEDGKPWMSTNMCRDRDNQIKITGPSEEGRWIANPSMLVAIEYAFYFGYYDDENWCNSPDNSLIPLEISYSPKLNEITVVYNYLPFSTLDNTTFYDLNGVNARDLGYPYFYVDKSKSSYDIKFANEPNASTSVQQFQNFIHTGGSCGHEGGCNNGSPRQMFAEFKADFKDYYYQNQEIYIKLWHQMPSSPSEPADITERIILRRS